MSNLGGMPIVGLIVIFVILSLFVLAVILLFGTYGRYRRLNNMVSGSLDQQNSFMRHVVNEFAAAYKRQGDQVNTPAIVESSVGTKLGGSLLCERFLNNSVSLFVTLGLFGTFLGLSLAVASLTELIGYSNTSEWLSVLDSVGEGLMSALSGMGVAFYTSLVGVACSIVLTILRTVFNPQNERAKLQTRLELWLDHKVAPTLPTVAAKDDVSLIHQMIDALNAAANSMDRTLTTATGELRKVADEERNALAAFNKTVDTFNGGVRDFSELNYNLRGTIERMDVSVRDVVSSLREVSRSIERSGL